MMPMTTRSSTSVNARGEERLCRDIEVFLRSEGNAGVAGPLTRMQIMLPHNRDDRCICTDLRRDVSSKLKRRLATCNVETHQGAGTRRAVRHPRYRRDEA